jgi:Family of unknown function (DUF6088)
MTGAVTEVAVPCLCARRNCLCLTPPAARSAPYARTLAVATSSSMPTPQRLVKWGELRRIDRGLYDKPLFNSLTQQQSAPDPRAVIDAVGRRDQIRVLVDGMTAANDLGFTNAVPARIVVHSEARPKSIKLGNLAITFKHTAASKLHWAGRPAMRVVQALHWLRDTMPGDDDGQWHQRLASLLADPVHGADLRDDLADGMTTLPSWMQDMLRPLIADEASAA